MQTLKSNQDASVNFVHAGGFESRYVSRNDDYFIVYLSSHNGCNKACRFCHLTQTGQTDMEEATMVDYLAQLVPVINHYQELVESGQRVKAKKVHFNFMARGDAFASEWLWQNGKDLRVLFEYIARELDLDFRINVSTIMPKEAGLRPLSKMFGTHKVQVYYSLYSVNPEFRRRWLPHALPIERAFYLLWQWKQCNPEYLRKDVVTIHFALIDGENDSQDDILNLIHALKNDGLKPKFNIVRYNPANERCGKESPIERINEIFTKLTEYHNHENSKIVERVGFDVAASCGMFINTKG